MIFSINLFRPTPFILEAYLELTAIQEDLGLRIFDPQSPNEGAVTPDDVVLQYQISGAKAANALLKDGEDGLEFYPMPKEDLERIWIWNFEKEMRQAECGEDYFVPQMSALMDDRPTICFIWSDGVPAIVPRVESIFIFRSATAPRMGVFRSKQDVVDVLTWDQWHSNFGHLYAPHDEHPDTFIPKDTDPSTAEAALKAFRAEGTMPLSQMRTEGRPMILPFEKLLDQEFFD